MSLRDNTQGNKGFAGTQIGFPPTSDRIATPGFTGPVTSFGGKVDLTPNKFNPSGNEIDNSSSLGMNARPSSPRDSVPSITAESPKIMVDESPMSPINLPPPVVTVGAPVNPSAFGKTSTFTSPALSAASPVNGADMVTSVTTSPIPTTTTSPIPTTTTSPIPTTTSTVLAASPVNGADMVTSVTTSPIPTTTTSPVLATTSPVLATSPVSGADMVTSVTTSPIPTTTTSPIPTTTTSPVPTTTTSPIPTTTSPIPTTTTTSPIPPFPQHGKDSTVSAKNTSSTPPIEIPDDHVFIETTYGSYIVPKYDEMNEADQAMHRGTFALRLQLLNSAWSKYGLKFDDVGPDETLTNIHIRYKQSVRYINARSGADFYKLFLVLGWLAVELLCVKIGLKASGYTKSQLRLYDLYHNYMIEMGETGGFGEGWAPWVKILVISMINIAVFVLLNTILGENNDKSDQIMILMSKFITGESSPTTTDGNDLGVPEPAGGLGGMDLGSIIGNLGGMFTGQMQGQRQAPRQETAQDTANRRSRRRAAGAQPTFSS